MWPSEAAMRVVRAARAASFERGAPMHRRGRFAAWFANQVALLSACSPASRLAGWLAGKPALRMGIQASACAHQHRKRPNSCHEAREKWPNCDVCGLARLVVLVVVGAAYASVAA